MKRSDAPPRSATRLLEDFGPKNNQEALAGDLLEAFQQGRSRAWYWRQVFAAIQWRRPLTIVLAGTIWCLYLAALDFRIGSTGWLEDAAAQVGLFTMGIFLPALLSGRGRACLSLLIIALTLLQPHFIVNNVPGHFPSYYLPLCLIFYRKPDVLYCTLYAWYFVVADLHPGSIREFLSLTAIATFCFVLDFVRPRLPALWKACLCVLLIAGSFLSPFLGRHFLAVPFCSLSLLFPAERRSWSRTMTLRQLWRNDSHDEKLRMIANLEETMAEEQNPELRQAYGSAIARLQEKDPAPPGFA